MNSLPSINTPSFSWDTIFNNQIFVIVATLVVVIFVLWLMIFTLRKTIARQRRLSNTFSMVTLMVTVPKESLDEDDERKPLEEKLAVAEAFMSTVGGMISQKGIRAFLLGRSDHFAFEIVANKGLISFYVTVPCYMQQYMEQQIQAQYHRSQIEVVEDYNIFTPRGVIEAAYLKLKKRSMFPILTYKKLGSDPLNSLTNVLSKFQEDEGAVLQIMARSSHPAWHKAGAKVATEMSQGKNVKDAMKSSNPSILGQIGKTALASTKKSKKDDYEYDEPRRLTPMEEETVKGLEEKTAKAGLDVNIRIIVSSPDGQRAKANIRNIADAFSQYSGYEYINAFVKKRVWRKSKIIRDFIYRNFSEKNKFILNAEEIASVYHFPLPNTETPNIRWLVAKKSAPPVNMPQEGLILGRNFYRGLETQIRIKRDDRRRHIYIIGKSGTGKSVLISSMAIQDIQNGEGVCVVDPHGDLIEYILAHIPKERAEDVAVFAPADMEKPVGLNMLEADSVEDQDFAIQEMIAIFYKLFPPEMIGPMFEHNMRNVMLTLMADKENPGTIAEIPRMFTDPAFQKYKLTKVTDPVVRNFWEKEMAKTTDFHKSEMLGYLISKVGRFVENEMMRNIIGQPKSGFDIREIMDKQKILLVNLSKGKVGEVNSDLLGLIIVSKLQMAALNRGDIPEEERKDFYLYIDEFQNYATDSIATILSEARKYRLNLTMAHQYIGQLVKNNDTQIRDAVLGTTGTMVAFKVGVDDAEVMAKVFDPVFDEYDVLNVEKFTAYIKLLVDNQASRAFNMHTYPPVPGNKELAHKIKELSRLKYGRPKSKVQAEIMNRSQLGEPSKPSPSLGTQDLGREPKA
ncbi:MAG: type IV secretory system conjugative DNA transfer family protein [Patescibacteria group bacterium]